MNWDAIGAVGEILGAFAVLATLLYVALQIRQTNEISRFNTTKEIMAKFDDLNGRIAGDSNLRNALMKTDALSADELEQVYSFAQMFFNTWYMCQSAYDNDLVEEAFFVTARKDVVVQMERWPNFGKSLKRMLMRYPELRQNEIYLAIDESDS
jgi:hypothetical protein